MFVGSPHLTSTTLERAFDEELGLVILTPARGAADAIETVRRDRPDVVLLDQLIPDAELGHLVEELLDAHPDAAILVLHNGDEASLRRALMAGARGYVTPAEGIGELVTAIRRVARGEPVIPPDALASLMRRGEDDPPRGLTAREREILRLVSRGGTSAQIASTLGLSVHTVRNHVQRILNKLGAHSRVEAVSIAAQEGFLDRWGRA